MKKEGSEQQNCERLLQERISKIYSKQLWEEEWTQIQLNTERPSTLKSQNIRFTCGTAILLLHKVFALLNQSLRQSSLQINQRNSIQNYLAHRRHLRQLSMTKSLVDTNLPWVPSHSLSKCSNKYANSRNQKIQHDNQVLLNKMMWIDNKQSLNNLNHSSIQIHSIANYNRRKNQETIFIENKKISERIQTANKKSIYGKQVWKPENEKCEVYRSNILKKSIKATDYTQLTKASYPNEKFVIRKLNSATTHKRYNTQEDQRQLTKEDVDTYFKL